MRKTCKQYAEGCFTIISDITEETKHAYDSIKASGYE